VTECKSTVMDLKKKTDDDSDETNPQLIGSLMYPVNTRLDSCHTVNVMSQLRQTHLATTKHVLRHSWVWSEICLQCELEFAE
jgi:hypothetical protein